MYLKSPDGKFLYNFMNKIYIYREKYYYWYYIVNI